MEVQREEIADTAPAAAISVDQVVVNRSERFGRYGLSVRGDVKPGFLKFAGPGPSRSPMPGCQHDASLHHRMLEVCHHGSEHTLVRRWLEERV